jgi:prepilin signal peptidase PulO-like enzyme (type II secretory pathway)
LLAVAVCDIRTKEIPDKLHLMLIPLAILAVWAWQDVSIAARIIGIFVISVPMFALAAIKENAFGGGDIKLMAVCGFLLGWQNVVVAFCIAVLLGGAWATFLLITKRAERGQLIAFSPMLCTGILVALIWGNRISGWFLY